MLEYDTEFDKYVGLSRDQNMKQTKNKKRRGYTTKTNNKNNENLHFHQYQQNEE